MLFFGLLNLPWWGYVIFTLVMTHITMVCVTVFLHRAQSHRALDLHPIMEHFFRFWLWLTTGMVTKEWVAVHRRHHAKCETPEDPHSPVIEGISKVLWEGAELYRTAKKDPETLAKYGKGTPDDWVERRIYGTGGKAGVFLMLLINLVLLGVPGLIVWGIQMMWTPFFAAGVINGIGHYFGYRNFECPDASVNIVPWGILIAGEELHNNHHAYGTSAKLSVKWWEFDIGWFYIQAMRAVGLAKVKRLPPKMFANANTGKTEMDLETVKDLFTNRLQVLSDYSKRVIAPVFKLEQKNTWDSRKKQTLSNRVRGLLIRDKSLVSVTDATMLKQALSMSERLATVYHFKDRLLEIWNRRGTSNEELLKETRDWCQQAETSGIDALREFAGFVRSYQQRAA